MNKNEPQNLFTSTDFLAIVGFCYFTVISPAIDKYAEGRLNREETIKTLNGIVYAVLASSLKLLDKNVYTPNLIPGRSKQKALDNMNETILPATTSIVKEVVTEAVKEVVNTTVNNLKTDVNNTVERTTNEAINTILPNENSIENNIAKAVIPNIINSNIDSNIEAVNDTVNDLFKTSKAIKRPYKRKDKQQGE